MFTLLESVDDFVGEGGGDDLPDDLDNVIGDHNFDEQRSGPRPHKGDGIKDQCVHSFPDERRANGAGPKILTFGQELHLGEHIGVG